MKKSLFTLLSIVLVSSVCYCMSQPPAMPTGTETKTLRGMVVSDELKMHMGAQKVGVSDDQGDITTVYIFSNTDTSHLSRLMDMGSVAKNHKVEVTYYITSDGLNAATMMQDIK